LTWIVHSVSRGILDGIFQSGNTPGRAAILSPVTYKGFLEMCRIPKGLRKIIG